MCRPDRAYTSAGIVIGGTYAPPPPPLTPDCYRIQSALLDPLTAQPLPLHLALWRWVVRRL